MATNTKFTEDIGAPNFALGSAGTNENADPSDVIPQSIHIDTPGSEPAAIPSQVGQALAQQTGQIAQKFQNDIIGSNTNNVVDPNFVASPDVPAQPPTPAQSSSGGLNTGDWSSLDYAVDWNAHHGKFKFLFKIQFGGGPWQYYAKSVSKPKVRMVHNEANYYNFRTKVLTQVQFEPITVILWDEIGDSTNNFFASYLNHVSGQGDGNWGIDNSYDPTNSSSSSKSYRNAGYGESILSTVVIEQIFANGTKSNRFTFKNARIETMDLDDLAHEANEMSTLTLTFNYDSLECSTVDHSVIYTDPTSTIDLLRGGGSAGSSNGQDDDGGTFPPISIGGGSSPLFPGFVGIGNQVQNIFDNAIPSINGSVTVDDGVDADFNASIPGFGSNLRVGPLGISGGIAGGLPGVGGSVNFGPGGISATIGGVTNVSSSQSINEIVAGALISPIPQIIPQQGQVVTEAQYVSRLSIAGSNTPSDITVQPFPGS